MQMQCTDVALVHVCVRASVLICTFDILSFKNVLLRSMTAHMYEN